MIVPAEALGTKKQNAKSKMENTTISLHLPLTPKRECRVLLPLMVRGGREEIGCSVLTFMLFRLYW